MESAGAKNFLISCVIEEAAREQVGLSNVEKKMLSFTESGATLPRLMDVNAEFERDYDADEYENKIARLLKAAREHDRKESPEREQQWEDALLALQHEDHYILVMVDQAFGKWSGAVSKRENRLRDVLIYIGVGLGIVAILVAAAWRNY
jgi:aromatic ring-opening dioxygenase catalytic subunit (LigB family)